MNETELYDYTYEQFINLPNDERELYKAYGLHAKPRNPNTKEPLEWQWGKVKQIMDLVGKESMSWEELTEVIMLASEKERTEVMQMKWHQVLKYYTFVVATVKMLAEREKQLSYEPDAKEMLAGVEERYSKFGWFATLYRLSGGDPLKYDEIGKQAYSVIFATLLLQKTDIEYNKALMKANTHV